MEIRKAIIPIAGWGTRRLPITKVIEKSMLPVGNRPVVDYVVEDCIKAGIKDIYLVIGNVEPSQVRAYYGRNQQLEKYLTERSKTDQLEMLKTAPSDVNFHYIIQPDDGRYGTAIPVALVAEQYDITEPVAVLMGDDFIYGADGGSEVANLINKVEDVTDSVILGALVDKSEVSRYGVLEVSDDGLLTGIVEKPSIEQAPSNLINISKYIMSEKLLNYVVNFVASNDFGFKEEFLITDPIFDYIREGNAMRVLSASGKYLDSGTLEGWLKANNVVCGNN